MSSRRSRSPDVAVTASKPKANRAAAPGKLRATKSGATKGPSVAKTTKPGTKSVAKPASPNATPEASKSGRPSRRPAPRPAPKSAGKKSPKPMPFRSGFVALVGKPNVGKSTLLNALLGEKVAIVSPKPQTTRNRIYGILNLPNAQIIFVDTPGLIAAKTPLGRALRRVTGTAASDADMALVLIESTPGPAITSDADRDVVDTARRSGIPVILAINKIDKAKRKDDLLPIIAAFSSTFGLDVVIPVSALKGDGLEPLLDEILSRLPEGPALFPVDMHTDQAERFVCAELVREQLLFQTQDEVPHSATVVIDSFEDGRENTAKPLCRLEGRIVVERDSQKPIVIGKGGERIKSISSAARREMEEVLGCQVYLRMDVTVDRNWTTSEQAVRRYGIGVEDK